MSDVQTWIDKMARLAIDIIGSTRNQTYVNQEILAKGELNKIKKNKIGALILGKRPSTGGDILPLSSTPVRNDLFNFIQAFQQNMTEMGGSDEQRISGQSSNKTLGQDELASVGTQIREGGLQDRLRETLVQESYKWGDLIKMYSNAELHFAITAKDFASPAVAERMLIDPKTGEKTEERWVDFMTQNNPLSIRHYMEGDFDYNINIYEAQKMDRQSLRREYDEITATYSVPQVQQALLQQGKRFRFDKVAEARANTMEFLNADDLIETLDPQQQAAIQATQALEKSGGVVPPELGGADQEVNVEETEQPQEGQPIGS